MKYIFFTTENVIAPIAYKLKEEGHEVTLAVVDDLSQTLTDEEKKGGFKPENPGKKKRRLSMYDGTTFPKIEANKVLKLLPKLNPRDYHIFSDYNSLFYFTEKALKMGFTGMLPRQEHRILEVDRDKGKKIVEKNYPDLKTKEHKEFKTSEEGIDFLEDSDKVWVLKSLGDSGETVVPKVDDPKLANAQIVDVLTRDKKAYEENGYLLEQKIIHGAEMTPQAVFLNGKLVYTSLDIETKTIGSGELGPNRGCGTNLIVRTSANDQINKIAFPSYVHQLAKKTKGVFIIDAGIIFDKEDGTPYFTEFCFQRFGWDAMPTEVTMSDSASSYFENLMKGKNPLSHRFGIGIRLFNLNLGDDHLPEAGLSIQWDPSVDENLYLYDSKIEDEKVVTAGYQDDLGVLATSGDSLAKTIDDCYEASKKVSLKDLYFRSKDDMVSTNYIQSVINRLRYAVEKGWIEDGGIMEDIYTLTGEKKQKIIDDFRELISAKE